jgi:molecular chaperone GrpE
MVDRPKPAMPNDDDAEEQVGEVTLELDGQDGDLDAVMREAVAAVEGRSASGGMSGDSASESTGAVSAAEGPDDELSMLRRELADLRDRSTRTLADYDNFRKRAERERQEIRRYALLEPMRDLLPVADNLERALSAGGSAEDLKAGVGMILRQLTELLRRFGVHDVPTDGQAFDPALHEAVAREERTDIDHPIVAETLVRGYLLHDRLLRPAMVKVAVPAERRQEERHEEPA